jgi:hypothetical protein
MSGASVIVISTPKMRRPRRGRAGAVVDARALLLEAAQLLELRRGSRRAAGAPGRSRVTVSLRLGALAATHDARAPKRSPQKRDGVTGRARLMNSTAFSPSGMAQSTPCSLAILSSTSLRARARFRVAHRADFKAVRCQQGLGVAMGARHAGSPERVASLQVRPGVR